MRDYVFYPFALSRPIKKLSKAAGARLGKNVSRTIPAAAGNLLIFLLVGLWHGASLNYVLWGMYNGLILAAASLMEHVYKAWNERHSVLAASKGFYLFRIIRTFLVVNIGWFFDRSSDPSKAIDMITSLFVRFEPGSLTSAFFKTAGLAAPEGVVLAAAMMIVFIVSLLGERGIDVRARIMVMPYLLRLSLVLAACCSIVVFGVWGSGFDAAAFIYNGF